jgi:hypothetical protein
MLHIILRLIIEDLQVNAATTIPAIPMTARRTVTQNSDEEVLYQEDARIIEGEAYPATGSRALAFGTKKPCSLRARWGRSRRGTRGQPMKTADLRRAG